MMIYRRHRIASAAIAAALLSGCAPSSQPAMQQVRIVTNPAGAACTVERDGARLGAVASTPAALGVAAGNSPLFVACTKTGYQPATLTVPFAPRQMTLDNATLDATIGHAINAPAGNRYPDPIIVTMAPVSAGGAALPY
jgi:hypothetical protein